MNMIEFLNRSYVVVLLTILALLLFSVPVFRIFQSERKRMKTVWIAAYLLILIWLFRFMTAYLQCLMLENESNGLSFIEELSNSLIHALQTFSMDEDYTEYTLNGKQLLAAVGLTRWSAVYGLVISFLNVCAPILGGAVLLDILTSFLPKLRLLFLNGKDVFVFSAMNEASVTLAEDICREDNYRKIMDGSTRIWNRKPLLVFTDAYRDKEEEIDSELFDRVKELGAICLREDIKFLTFRRTQSVTYLLLDASLQENLNTLKELLNNGDKGENTRIFLFSEEECAGELVNSLCAHNQSGESQMLVRLVRSCRNAVMNLMYDVPLFLPLLSVPENERNELHVTILGESRIAEEFFKAAFWCGQMNGVQLHLNLAAHEAEAFEEKLRAECPELLPGCDPNAELLNVYPGAPDKQKNPPYAASVRFLPLKNNQDYFCIPADIMETTDYFAVAFESDEENISAALWLKKQLMHRLLEQGGSRKPVIAVSVFDQVSGEALSDPNPAPAHPRVIAFADAQSRFNCENVFLLRFQDGANASAALYNKAAAAAERKDEYTFWANIARTIHVPYKLFGIGAIKGVTPKGSGAHSEYDYQSPLSGKSEHGNREQKEELEDIRRQLTWIEHRRWNAYLRSRGFQCPTASQLNYYYKNKQLPEATHKYVGAKLHPCLVESHLEESGEDVHSLPDKPDYTPGRYDYLDHVSMDVYTLKLEAGEDDPDSILLENFDYKKYDDPSWDKELSGILERVQVLFEEK